MNIQKIYRIAGLTATVSAILLSVADFLLEFTPEYGVSSQIVEPAWTGMAGWRFTTSIYLCAFLIPFYIAGFWLLYRVISRSSTKIAVILFIMFSYGVIMGSPLIHTVMSLNPVIYKYGTGAGIESYILKDLIEGEITTAIFPVFIFHYILTWLIAPAVLFVYIISGKSVFKRWVAFLNPLVFLIVFMAGLYLLPDFFKFLAPGAINKGNAMLFMILTIKTWNYTE